MNSERSLTRMRLGDIMHLLFYDGECGLCDNIVRFLLKIDKKELFIFAPLQGETAKKVLKDLPEQYKDVDSLVLIENFGTDSEKFYVLGKGALRIFWLLGGFWKLIGWISFLPSFLYDWIYRIVARNRKKLFRSDFCILPSAYPKERFLP